MQWEDGQAPWAAGQAAVSHSTHLLSPGFGGPPSPLWAVLAGQVLCCRTRDRGEEMQTPFAAPDGSHPVRPPRNQLLLREASGVLFNLGKRS